LAAAAALVALLLAALAPQPASANLRAGAGVAPAHTYVFPVRPAAKARYSRYHHDYPAADIFCPVGSAFVAPTDGVVDYVSRVDLWKPATDEPVDRGGLAVAIVGSDGVRYYGSHLSSVAKGIEPGVRVRAGRLLGYTGKSGNARSTAPHLHFGISHPTDADDWQVRRGKVPPYTYLKAWQRGEMLTPKLPAS
jgi:murein DD-endopeptidase MepM/ murein hydrolase activator NlpD